MPNTILLNPILEENLALVCKLVETQLGKAPGKLEEYRVYSYIDGEGVNHKYALTHPLIQFTADPLIAAELAHQRIIDVFEPTVEGAGSYGSLYPVVRSILFTDDLPSFDTKSYVIKKIKIDSAAIADKPSKPPAGIRAIRREQYIGSHFLGSNYQTLEGADEAFLHMERAPGKPLHYYWNKLNAEEFLSLTCALLEQIPQQLQRIITHGKHAGKQIVHCDITANNILAYFNEGKWTVKLVDFGLAKAKKLDERYISKRARGTTFHYDQRMFSADLHREPLIFTRETDIYALYNVILELAGYYYRLEKRGLPALLLRDLERPSLDNLFNGMDFPLVMKSQLRELMCGMMDADRSRRISHDAALTGFQLALTGIDKSTFLATPVAEGTELPITISSLKQLIEQPLKEDPKALSTWISTFRTVYLGLSTTEQSEWKSSARSLAFNSPYTYS